MTEETKPKEKTIPVLKIKDYVFSFYKMSEEDLVKLEKGSPVKPLDVIKEMRAMQRENRDFMTVLAVLLASATKGEESLKEVINQMKLVIKDLNGKQFFPFED
jgi:siroheme synthase